MKVKINFKFFRTIVRLFFLVIKHGHHAETYGPCAKTFKQYDKIYRLLQKRYGGFVADTVMRVYSNNFVENDNGTYDWDEAYVSAVRTLLQLAGESS